MKSLFRKWLIGEDAISVISKITTPDDLQQKVWLRLGNKILDVSKTHSFLCIEPIIFGVWIEKDAIQMQTPETTKYQLYVGNSVDAEKNSMNNPEARLSLELFDYIEDSGGTFLLLRLKKNNIYHLNFLKRNFIYFWYYKRNGFTYSRFKSFVAAYSYPRRIRIVSFRQDQYFNIFPMDLLSDLSPYKRFAFGLQNTNTTLPKIIETGKLVVSEVSHSHKEIIYQLGKHHSSSPPALDALPFDVISSKQFGFYIPVWAESYKEIKILKTINMGSHMLLWGELVGEEQITEPSDHLFLVHYLHYLHQKTKGVKYTLV